MKEFVCYHTNEILRKHQLLMAQYGGKNDASFELVDWQTHKKASTDREDEFFEELERFKCGKEPVPVVNESYVSIE